MTKEERIQMLVAAEHTYLIESGWSEYGGVYFQPNHDYLVYLNANTNTRIFSYTRRVAVDIQWTVDSVDGLDKSEEDVLLHLFRCENYRTTLGSDFYLKYRFLFNWEQDIEYHTYKYRNLIILNDNFMRLTPAGIIIASNMDIREHYKWS